MIGSIGGSIGLSNIYSQNKPSAASVFQKADADNSGGLTLAEFAPNQKTQSTAPVSPVKSIIPSAEEAFNMLDADGNGEISLTEFEEGNRPPPPPLNTSVMSSSTFSSLLEIQELSISGDASAIEELIDKLMENIEGAEAAFLKGDEDEDGVLSEEEFTSLHESKHGNKGRSADEVFSMIDSDGNGEISQEEFMNAPHVCLLYTSPSPRDA